MVYGDDHPRVAPFLAVPQNCSGLWGFRGETGDATKKGDGERGGFIVDVSCSMSDRASQQLNGQVLFISDCPDDPRLLSAMIASRSAAG